MFVVFNTPTDTSKQSQQNEKIDHRNGRVVSDHNYRLSTSMTQKIGDEAKRSDVHKNWLREKMLMLCKKWNVKDNFNIQADCFAKINNEEACSLMKFIIEIANDTEFLKKEDMHFIFDCYIDRPKLDKFLFLSRKNDNFCFIGLRNVRIFSCNY